MTIRNNKVLVSTAVAAAIVASLAVPSMALASTSESVASSAGTTTASPSVRTAGGVGFLRAGVATFVGFEVRSTGPAMPGEDHQPASGKLSLMAADGTKLSAKIDHVHVHAPGEVHFGGTIVRSHDANLIGKFVHVVVVDGGAPGRGGDRISVVISDTPMHEHGVLSPVTRGNLSIRTR